MNIPCLSLWQPWASVIFAIDPETKTPAKIDETRGWPTHVRGLIAIHASKHPVGADDQRYYGRTIHRLGLQFASMPFGKIIGTVELVNCRPTVDVVPHRSDAQLFWGNYEEIEDGKRRYAFELRNPVLLPEPIPFVGRQGFFNVELSDAH
jgi:hypothetical protein